MLVRLDMLPILKYNTIPAAMFPCLWADYSQHMTYTMVEVASGKTTPERQLMISGEA